MTRSTPAWVVLAHLLRPQGRKGEVLAELFTDFPERFEKLTTLIGVAPDENRRSLQIEEQWFHLNRIVFKFAGFDGIDAAKELVGYDLAVPEDERVDLPPDSFYEWELIGCHVQIVDGTEIGKVEGVMRTGGVEILKVVDETGRDRLIPMASEIVVEIDKEKKLIRIDPPAGLLEL